MGFYASYRILLSRAGAEREEHRALVEGEAKLTRWVTRQTLHAKVEKSRVGSPLKDVYFVWSLVESRVDVESWLLDQAVELGYATVEKRTYLLGGVKAVGRPAMVAKLRDDPDLVAELRRLVWEFHAASRAGTESGE